LIRCTPNSLFSTDVLKDIIIYQQNDKQGNSESLSMDSSRQATSPDVQRLRTERTHATKQKGSAGHEVKLASHRQLSYRPKEKLEFVDGKCTLYLNKQYWITNLYLSCHITSTMVFLAYLIKTNPCTNPAIS